MSDTRRTYYRNNLKRRRRRVLKIKIFMVGSFLAIILLSIYIIVTLLTLIAKTVEYKEAATDNGNIVYEQVEKTEGDITSESNEAEDRREVVMDKLDFFAQLNDFSVNEYPEELIELLEKNPETENFVLNYPLQKNSYSQENLDECLNNEEVPLLIQWDSRWGYYEYGDNVMGLTGCGPTCLSMVAIHVLQNSQLTPIYMADYAQRNGYYAQGIGTAWSFMSQGARALGLDAQEVGLDERKVLEYLQQGKPIICAMGRGDFTETGHFIVFVGVEDGKIKVNDPNSKERSEKLWEFEDIKYQIKNMWVYSRQ